MTRFILIVAILVFTLCGFFARASAQVNVTQKNNNFRATATMSIRRSRRATRPIWCVT